MDRREVDDVEPAVADGFKALGGIVEGAVLPVVAAGAGEELVPRAGARQHRVDVDLVGRAGHLHVVGRIAPDAGRDVVAEGSPFIALLEGPEVGLEPFLVGAGGVIEGGLDEGDARLELALQL